MKKSELTKIIREEILKETKSGVTKEQEKIVLDIFKENPELTKIARVMNANKVLWIWK